MSECKIVISTIAPHTLSSFPPTHILRSGLLGVVLPRWTAVFPRDERVFDMVFLILLKTKA